MGYRVRSVPEVSEALQIVPNWEPDLILTKLKLPDLSGKDLLVALRSREMQIPVILIGFGGGEMDMLHSFRLGATDYLTTPVREAELVTAVERALNLVRADQERDDIAQQLLKTSQELQRRTREFNAVHEVGRELTAIKNLQRLLQKIVDGGVRIGQADGGWLSIRSERSPVLILAAQRNLPAELTQKINKPWDDGISSLVSMSGEPLTITGRALEQFPLSRLGKSLHIAPIRAQEETIGLLALMRVEPLPFDAQSQSLIAVLCDYAASALVNARLFQALEERTRLGDPE